MSVATLYGLCAAALVGIGLYGLIVLAHPLRKIIAFNVIGSAVFILFGAVAKRAAAAGFGGDPVPQALLITRHRRRLLGHGAGRGTGRAADRGHRLRFARCRSTFGRQERCGGPGMIAATSGRTTHE